MAPTTSAQGADPGTTQPDQLWSYDPPGDASINDVSVDSRGRLAAAVQGDAQAGNQDDEVFLWDLARSPESEEPVYGADPTTGTAGIDPTVPEGLSVVAVEPGDEGEPEFVAVGYAGTSKDIYVYSSRRGPESASVTEYPDDNQPSGDVVDLWFMSSNWLVAQHGGDGVISLLQRSDDTTFTQRDRWTPDQGDDDDTSETIQDADLSGDGSRLIVAASEGVGETTINLHVLERDDGELVQVTHPESRSRSSAGAVVDLDRTGGYALFGTGDNALFYYQLVDEPDTEPSDDDADTNFSAAWSARGGSAVSAVELAPNGETFAAGFDDGEIVVYEQTEVTDEGPLAARAVKSGYDGRGSVTELDFSRKGQELVALGGSLHGFHARQFGPNDALSPIWTIPSITGVSVTDDGSRFLASTSQTVRAYEQSYEARIDVDAPEQVQPGQTSQIDVRINNTGSTFDQFKLSTKDVPSTWTVGFNQTEVPLLPGGGARVSLNVTPDRSQEPTNLTFAVEATSQRSPDGRTAASTDVSVEVPVVRAASVSTDADRIEATRGQTSVITVDVANDGNTRTGIRLGVDQESDWSVAIDGQDGTARSFDISPGENRSVDVGLAVPDSAAEGSSNEVTIEARPTAGGSGDTVSVDLLVEPSFGARVTGPSNEIDVEPDTDRTFTVGVRNTGNTQDSYSLRVHSNATNPEHLWRASLSSTQVTVDAGGNGTVDVTVSVPRGAAQGEATEVTIVAHSQTTGDKVDENTFTLRVPEETDDSPLGLVLVPAALGLAALARRRQA